MRDSRVLVPCWIVLKSELPFQHMPTIRYCSKKRLVILFFPELGYQDPFPQYVGSQRLMSCGTVKAAHTLPYGLTQMLLKSPGVVHSNHYKASDASKLDLQGYLCVTTSRCIFSSIFCSGDFVYRQVGSSSLSSDPSSYICPLFPLLSSYRH